MKRILILGINSFTGSHLNKILSKTFDIFGTATKDGNGIIKFNALTDDISLIDEKIKLNKIDVVINCISLGNVDTCESDKELCLKLNYTFVESLVSLQEKLNFHLIHFSTNAVYSGTTGYYSETSKSKPINYYGQTKLKADNLLLSASKRVTILRPITMYGPRISSQRHNPFSFFLEEIASNKDVIAVNDVYVNFLYVNDLVECVKKSIEKNIFGLFNISGNENLSRVGFAQLILNSIPNSTSKIKSVSSSEFPTIAQRPKDTSFNNDLMRTAFEVNPTPIHKVINDLVIKRGA